MQQSIGTIFDVVYYRSNYIDQLVSSKLSPLDHFMMFGWKTGCCPNNWFNPVEYRKYYTGNGNPMLEWLSAQSGITHEPENQLIVSMTSHPPRIERSWLAIESIMRQSKKPQHIILTLASEDFPNHKLPISIKLLTRRGLTVSFSDINYKVSTKLIPVLGKFPNSTIITLDDDRIYHPELLATLWKQHVKYPTNIICPVARHYICDEEGKIDYVAHCDSPSEISSKCGRINYLKQSPLFDTEHFAIFEGFAGVLYPPHSLDLEVFNFNNFMEFTPYADDVWFQAMAILKGTKSRGLPENITQIFKWPLEIDNTQEHGLFHKHLLANDWMVYRVLYHYNLLSFIGITENSNMICQICHRKICLFKQGEVKPVSHKFSNKVGKRCKSCLNSRPRRILCIGSYDYGNIGDQMYKIVLQHFLGTDFDVFTIPDTVRINTSGTYISINSKQADLDYDFLIIGGGGILRDFPPECTISYYMNQSIVRGKPFFILSAGLQTTLSHVKISDAKRIINRTVDTLKKAALIFVRSQEDYSLIRAVLGDEVQHKLHSASDISYLFPTVIKETDIYHKPVIKKYITLIQTGTINVNMSYVRNKIKKKLREFPTSQLVVMNWGGSENPTSSKDFEEFDLFAIETKKIFPHAIVYMGDSISMALKELCYSHIKTRKSDLTPFTAARFIEQSHCVISGRYHGKILACAYGVPFELGMFSYKINSERESRLPTVSSMESIKIIKSFIENDSASILCPDLWTDDDRNTFICKINKNYPELTIPFIQAMDNILLYKFMCGTCQDFSI
jgi:exopolysaccharide biosynthesis predicted pyruvyltransferase EpsI